MALYAAHAAEAQQQDYSEGSDATAALIQTLKSHASHFHRRRDDLEDGFLADNDEDESAKASWFADDEEYEEHSEDDDAEDDSDEERSQDSSEDGSFEVSFAEDKDDSSQ